VPEFVLSFFKKGQPFIDYTDIVATIVQGGISWEMLITAREFLMTF
jgi:hypothetical protein